MSCPVNYKATEATTREIVDITLSDTKKIGVGTFGVVYAANVIPKKNPNLKLRVAWKKVPIQPNYANRELNILLELNHPNIVKVHYYFSNTSSSDPKVTVENMLLELLDSTLSSIINHYNSINTNLPLSYVQLYSFQMLRALGYMHCQNICHRDLKPSNVLINIQTGALKLCDFGSAKRLVSGESNVAYVCSRYYRSPELVFGATDYSTSIDIWSTGCIIMEMLTNRIAFRGNSSVDQLVEIIRVLGTPTKEEVTSMNKNYNTYSFPSVNRKPFTQVIDRKEVNEECGVYDLLNQMLRYSPHTRISAYDACAHKYYDALRTDKKLSDGKDIPYSVVHYTKEEIEFLSDNLKRILKVK